MAKAKLDHNNSYEIIQINHQLIEASANGDVEECRRLVAEGGAKVNYVTFSGYGSTALYEAVKNNHFEIVQLLMENGADPIRCKGHWKCVQLATFGCVSDPRILDLLFQDRTTNELEQLRGCRHLVQGRLDRAFDYFFGEDYPLVQVIGNRAFETQLLIEYFRIQNKYNAKSEIVNPHDWLGLFDHFNKQDGQTCIDVVDFLIRETKLNYFLVYIFLAKYRLDLRQACEITDLVNVSVRLDKERDPKYLTYGVAEMVSKLVRSYAIDEDRFASLHGLAENIKKFPFKNDLITYHSNLTFPWCHLRNLRFLLELCEVDPNSRTEDCKSSAVDIMYRKNKNRMDVRVRPNIEESYKLLLRHGLHDCLMLKNDIGRGVRTQFLLEEMEISNIPKLKCLSALKITQAKTIDTSRLPERLKNFVHKLH